MVVHVCMDAIDKVVRCHESPGICLSDCNLKGSEVQLPERPFLDERIDCQAVGFLLIAHKIYLVVSLGWVTLF